MTCYIHGEKERPMFQSLAAASESRGRNLLAEPESGAANLEEVRAHTCGKKCKDKVAASSLLLDLLPAQTRVVASLLEEGNDAGRCELLSLLIMIIASLTASRSSRGCRYWFTPVGGGA